MKASVIHEYGGPEVLRYEDYPDPVLKQGEVLIRVAAAGLNPVDILERSGQTKDWRPIQFPGVSGVHRRPKRPIVLGGLIGPVLWSGLLYSVLSLLDPVLESHIDWLWFIASQVGFGIVAGLVVVRQPRVKTRENIAFAIRAGVEAPGITSPGDIGRERA